VTRAGELPIEGDPVVGRRYEVGEPIASGGFAKVFKAVQKATGQEVAIKVLRPEFGSSAPALEDQFERFRREMRLCAELHHPNVVPLIDSGETADGQLYAVFTYVPGWNLGDVLATEGALDPPEALHFMTQVIDAIGCAHARGIAHRDLKPGNVMINPAGARRNALVVDFGLGAISTGAHFEDLRRLTMRGEYLGTPAYSAPEQLRGEPPTPRSDLYAWGLIFLECLTGEHALGSAPAQEILHRQLGPDPVPIPAALEGHELGRVLRIATERNVEKRDLSAEEALAALQRCARSDLPSRREMATRGETEPARADGPAAWPPRPAAGMSPIWLVPLGRNPNFTGREDSLRQIAESVSESHLLAVVALHGLGGVGKTQLAVEYAYRYSDRYRLVAWIRAEEPETLAADYCAIGTPLEFPDTRDERARIEAVRSWLERNENWLLVFDNAPNPDALRAYLPRFHTGHILVTSRHRSWRALAASLPVEVLDRHEATEFLLKRTDSGDETAAAALSEELGRLPLALEEAAAYIEATGRSLGTYLPLLRDHQPDVLFGEPLTPDHPGSLRTAWELSFRQIEDEAPEASDLLRLCAYLAPDDVPLALIRRGGEHLPEALRKRVHAEVSLDGCIASLRRYSLVRTEPDCLSVHRLVQLATRERLTEAERERWAVLALRVVEAAYPHSTLGGAYLPESGRFLPHALAALSHTAPHAHCAEPAARLLQRTGIYRSVRGMIDLACDDLERALGLFESASAPDEEEIAGVLWELGMVRYALGEPAAARELLERSARIFEHRKGPTHPWLAQSLLALSWVLRTLGESEEALSVAERFLEIAERSLGEDHAVTSMGLSVMGRALWYLNRVPEARRCAQRALAVLTGQQDLHPIVVGTWNNLAQIHLDLGEFKTALDCVDRSLAVGEHAWGRDHPFMCVASSVRGAILQRLGDLEGARRCLEQALEGGQRVCRYLHEDIAIARSELGDVLRRLGDLDGARANLEHSLEDTALVCGDKARLEGHAQVALATLLRELGDLAGARRHCEAGLGIVEARFGIDHPLRIEGLGTLGSTLQDLGEAAEAERCFADALRIATAAGLSPMP
jgi:tetratricopeptide (TPR) repeat protein/tRNA A-37 threonylcarbamoyl transferase component Bud32